MVTLYHFDLPQALQDQGGWKSPGIAALFDSYARFCFQTFGDRVKLWLTINEPHVCAKLGHEDGIHAPGLKEPGIAAYLAGHNMLRAHAMAWHSYNSFYRTEQKGAVSLAINSNWLEPLHAGCAEDIAATERCRAFTLGWFTWPVFVNGDYPEIMRSAVDAQSKKLGYSGSPRLPSFSKDEPAVLGTADFFALNYYTSRKVKPGGGCEKTLCMKSDRDAEEVLDPSWPICGVSWLAVVPHGLRKTLKYIKVKISLPVNLWQSFSVMYCFKSAPTSPHSTPNKAPTRPLFWLWIQTIKVKYEAIFLFFLLPSNWIDQQEDKLPSTKREEHWHLFSVLLLILYAVISF